MKILGIETSCDETALCIADAKGDFENAELQILGNSILSQINLHREFGGVYPSLAKREHSINLTPMLEKVLKKSNLYQKSFKTKLSQEEIKEMESLLEKEQNLYEMLTPFLNTLEKPEIDKIAVTVGPGLEPALWTGVNFANILSKIWSIPTIPVNHMEGHILSSLLYKKEGAKQETEKYLLKNISFPAMALLISGGHTELVLVRDWGEYKKVGQTRDDALGEAFDKVARMLNLPYPGGPEISKLAEEARRESINPQISLPRPMINSGDLDFSFSGIKTSVMYKLKNTEDLTEEFKKELALDFEDSVTEVLTKKTKQAMEQYGTKTLLVGGGVSANSHIRESIKNMMKENFKNAFYHFPDQDFSMDNAVMIAAAGYLNELLNNKYKKTDILQANGGLSF